MRILRVEDGVRLARRYELVVLDVALPRIDGFEVLRRPRKTRLESFGTKARLQSEVGRSFHQPVAPKDRFALARSHRIPPRLYNPGRTMKIVCALVMAVTAGPLPAIEVTQLAGAAHAYPAMWDLNGKKLGSGEFSQEIQGKLLRIRISYNLTSGGRIEEQGAFQQQPELIQKEWSWREFKDGTLQRQYKIDFDSGTATASKREKGELKDWSDQVEVDEGRTFAGFGFALALQNLRDRLVIGEVIELKAIGFTPKPRVVTVRLSYHGIDRLGMSGRILSGEHFMIQPEIPAIAKLLIKVSDTHIWLTLPPSGFLRWEGPLAEPNDSLVRVDLASGDESIPAKPADKESGN